MLPLYEQSTEKLEIRHRKATHLPPHLHKSMECVLITEGTLAIGIGPELYEMKEGETIESVCLAVYGSEEIAEEIRRFNGLEEGENPQAGEKILLP